MDWVTIVVYLLLIVFGWFSVCGASYDYGDRDFLDFSTRAGKQFVWIICSFGLGFVLLMLDDSLYDMFSYLIYIGLMLLLIVTIFIAPDTKGSRSWLILGPVSLQPAEFAKLTGILIASRFLTVMMKREKKIDLNITTSISPLGQQGMRGSEPFYRKGIGRIMDEDDDE